MKIAIFADSKQPIEAFLQNRGPACLYFESYDDFISELPASGCDVVIVARPGAAGMETVRSAKILMPGVKVIWFSDDNGFGPESYRIGCAYFSASPITEERITAALRRCGVR